LHVSWIFAALEFPCALEKSVCDSWAQTAHPACQSPLSLGKFLMGGSLSLQGQRYSFVSIPFEPHTYARAEKPFTTLAVAIETQWGLELRIVVLAGQVMVFEKFLGDTVRFEEFRSHEDHTSVVTTKRTNRRNIPEILKSSRFPQCSPIWISIHQRFRPRQ
jgi:hypothetical protein